MGGCGLLPASDATPCMIKLNLLNKEVFLSAYIYVYTQLARHKKTVLFSKLKHVSFENLHTSCNGSLLLWIILQR